MNPEVLHILQEEIEKDSFFIAKVIMPTAHKIQIFVDGATGVSLQHCTTWNRKIRHRIEEEIIAYKEGNIEIEVSSFGIGEPLADNRQYPINIGRTIQITYVEQEAEALLSVIGKLISVENNEVEISTSLGKGKKASTIVKKIPINNIKKASIEIDF